MFVGIGYVVFGKKNLFFYVYFSMHYLKYRVKLVFFLISFFNIVLVDCFINKYVYVNLNAVYKFEDSLSNAERALVHMLCSKLGLRSKSNG